MKILFVSSDNNKTSGAFLCLVELNRYLREKYHIDTLVVIPKKGDGIQLLEKYDIPYRFIPSYSWITYNGYKSKAIAKTLFKMLMMIYNQYAIKKICKIIKDEGIELVHTNTIFAYVGAVAARKQHVRHVWHIRECIDKDYDSHILTGVRGYRLINKSDAVLTVSKMVRDNYRDQINSSNIQVIYDGVSASLYREKQLFLQDKVQFTCIGGLIAHKNQKEIIKACAILRQKGKKNFHLNLVGRGPMERELRDEVKDLGLESYITFCGVFNDIQDILIQTDVVCVASKSEAFGRTMIEGMLQGCLIIGADTPNSATREVIIPGKTGFLYPLGDIDTLAAFMSQCLNHDSQSGLQTIAQRGQENALQKYTTAVNAKNIVNVYNKLLDSPVTN